MTVTEYNLIVQNHADHLFRFLVKSTRDEHTADDLVQLSFERLWKNKHKVKQSKAKSYLFTIGYNAMIDYFRKNKRISFLEKIPDSSVQDITMNFELKDWIEQGLNQLNDLQRSLIVLRDYEGYSYREIGEITGLSESQVKVYIFRGRKAMKEFLTKHYAHELKNYGY